MPLISQLPTTVLPNRSHAVAAEREGLSVQLAIAQILGLLTDDDLLMAMPELSTYGSKLDATVINALTAKATLVGNDQFAVRDSVTGEMRKHSYTQLLALLAAKHPRYDAAAVLTAAQRHVLASNIGMGFEQIGFQQLGAAAASIPFTTADMADYREIRAIGKLIPVAAGGSPCFQFTKDAGATFIADTSAYYGEGGYFAGGGTAAVQHTTTVGPMTSTGVPAGAFAKFSLEVSDFNVNLSSQWLSRCVFNNGAGSMIAHISDGQMNVGVPNAIGVFNGIRFLSNVGNLAAGSYVYLYGQKG